MQRRLGYIFFLLLGLMGLASLYGRYHAVNSIFGEKVGPDWIGILLVGSALLGGVLFILLGRPRHEEKDHGRKEEKP